jgi:hypothetical protein
LNTLRPPLLLAACRQVSNMLSVMLSVELRALLEFLLLLLLLLVSSTPRRPTDTHPSSSSIAKHDTA